MADAVDQQQASLRQALAIAIVRNKRRCDQEAAEWRAKAQKLENDLKQQQAKQTQLQQWISDVLQQQRNGSFMPEPLGQTQGDKAQLLHSGIFLPPLSCNSWKGDQQPPAGNFHTLQQQVALAAAAAGDAYSSVADVLEGKAAALSSMLLTNVQMLQQLSAQPTGSAGSNSGCSAQGHASECVSSIGTFITSTLLQAPKSSLSSAYIKQSAAVLAAVLAPPVSDAMAPAAVAAAAGAAGCTQHSQQGQLGPDAPEALAVQVVRLMQQLLQLRAAGDADDLKAGAGTGSSSAAVGAAATVMLQQLSTFPSTALLLCLAAAQRMQKCVQELQEANAGVMRTSLNSFSMCAGAGKQALLLASRAFQAAHELLLDLVSTFWHLGTSLAATLGSY